LFGDIIIQIAGGVNMDIGDKVKMVKGNPFGKIGIIKFKFPLTGPVNLTGEPRGLNNKQPVMHFEVEAEDGTKFPAAEDQLELTE